MCAAQGEHVVDEVDDGGPDVVAETASTNVVFPAKATGDGGDGGGDGGDDGDGGLR